MGGGGGGSRALRIVQEIGRGAAEFIPGPQLPGDLNVKILQLKTGVNTVSGTIKLKAEVSGAVGDSEVRFEIEDLTLRGDKQYSRTFDTKQLPNGTYRLKVRAMDSAGQTAEILDEIDIKIDNPVQTAPLRVRIVLPKNNETVSGNIKICAEVSGGIGGTQVQFTIANRTLIAGDSLCRDFDSTELPNGTYRIKATARDMRLNTARNEITIKIRNPVH
jgi:major membrane immunogen (membrane-anchored lipoprotein)